MNRIQQIKDDYVSQTRELLQAYREELSTFDELWNAGKLREAYVFVTDTVHNLNILRTPDNIRADKDFFWTYMH